MSYQVLARKWRPQAFDDVVGQEHVTTPLRNAIRTDRVPHALLLAGPRGVGKTTLARILARCLNCDKGPTDTPCGECPPCREIAGGRSTDVQEIDAASRTSVDDVRELIEAVRYAPTPGKQHIYVVDEVHMLSTAAFNALLKTLEEPPPSTLFVFATTNPEKIPFTVLSRCQRYDLKRLPTAAIAERLGAIARSEGVEIGEASLRAVAREGDGSLRDAMTLLDQIVAYGGKQVDADEVARILDLIDRRLLLRITAACVDGEPAAALATLDEAGRAGIEARRLGGELLGLLRDLLVLRVAPDAPGLVDGSDDEVAELRALAERCEPARLRRMFRALLHEQQDLAWAPQPFAVLEMAAVRLATLAPGDEVSALLARLEQLERRLGGEPPAGGGGGPRGSRARGGAASAGGRAAPTQASAGPDDARAGAGDEASGAAPEPAARGATPEADAAPDAPAADPGPDPAIADAPLEVVLDRLRGVLRAEDRGLAASLEGGRLVERSPERLRLRVPKRFAAARLEGRRDRLESVAARLFGGRPRVEVEHAEDETPAHGAPVPDADRVRQQRQAALEHPGVNTAREVLGAEIVEIRTLGGGR